MSVPFGLIYRRIGWISWTTTCLLLVGCTEHTPPTGGGTGSAHLFEIRVEKKNIDELGADVTQEVTLDKAYYRLTGFDFTLAYDPVVVHVQSVQAGEMITNCEWEYFSYRNEVAGNFYAPGKLHVRAIAGANGGRPLGAGSCQTEEELTEPVGLFTIHWRYTENPTYECAYIPIRFYWEDCDDNIVIYSPGWGHATSIEAACHRIIDFGDISDEQIGFPTFRGYQWECHDVALNQGVPPVRLVDFMNGGLDKVCVDSIAVRGDIDLDGIPFDISDVVMFADYFTRGLEAFAIDREKQIAATDINGDGLTLTVSDLVYIGLGLWDDNLPFPVLGADDAECTIIGDVATIDRDVAAALIVIEGEVDWICLAEHTSSGSRFEDGRTIVVIMSGQDRQLYPWTRYTFTGPFLQTEGEIISIDMSTVDGARVDVTIQAGER